MITSKYIIPFNLPSLVGMELAYISEAINVHHLSGDGPFTRNCSLLLEQILSAKRALLTTSCTHALEMASILLNISPGDEVIIPSFTFVSTVNAFVLRGAIPRFLDIREDTLNMDETKLEGLINSHTKAIIPVHYAGVGCDMDAIADISKSYGIPIVEDNAHGLFGKYKGRYLGTFGDMATLSFHETKNFTCGEGGALIVNNEEFVERAEIIREKGTNRSRFFRGQVDKYTWVDIGSSYLPSDILAAFLFGQFEARDDIQARRKFIWEFYAENLADWASSNQVHLPTVPDYCEQPYHLFYMILPSLEKRQSLIAYLRDCGIQSVFHYLPLHLSDMGRSFGGVEGDCPVTEYVTDRLIRLPFFNSMSLTELQTVISSIQSFK